MENNNELRFCASDNPCRLLVFERDRYLDIIAILTKECAAARREIAQLKMNRAGLPVALEVEAAVAVPGPGVSRLERIISRIEKIAES